MTHRIEIPNWHPSRLNQFTDRHWSVRSQAKKRDREMIATYSLKADAPKATGRRRVSLEVLLKKGQRPPDEDAFWKSLLDGLVKAGMLTDDNRQGVQLGEIRHTRSRDATHGTTIVLEDVEPAAKIPRAKRGRKVG